MAIKMILRMNIQSISEINKYSWPNKIYGHDIHDMNNEIVVADGLVIFGGLVAKPWWRHQMETFSVLLALCAGNSPVAGEFPAQRPVTRSFGVFFDLRLNKWLVIWEAPSVIMTSV